MAMKHPETDEGQLNMTPMIDIVFQLILFFLFSLRFKGLDHRIDSQIPKDRGIVSTPTFVTDIPAIKISLFRLNEEKKEIAQTKIKLGNTYEVLIPHSEWTGKGDHDEALEAARADAYKQLEMRIKVLHDGNKELKGEIDTPPPKGGSVPHADIMRVLDSFLAAGVTEVNFQGAASPMPKGARKP